jgi:hypothetical protein
MLYIFEQGQDKVLIDLPALERGTIGKTIKIIKNYPYGPREGEDWFLHNVDYYRPMNEDDKVELL